MKHALLTLSLITAFTAAACQPDRTPLEGEAFLSKLTPHCGKAYQGRIVSNDDADDAWRQETITMHVRNCTDGEVKIALHVGENRSRTWILRYEDDNQLALRHDHRHQDGEPDALTFYGGFASDITATRMNFPADQSTKDLFDRENIPVSKDNIWAMTIAPEGEIFTYEMRRPNRDFRIEFNISKTVTPPPTPWGW